jgi:hypothetical protein
VRAGGDPAALLERFGLEHLVSIKRYQRLSEQLRKQCQGESQKRDL